jgi:hypothetical protein
VLETVKLRKLTIPPADELLSAKYPHYDYSKPFGDARWDPLFIM